MTNEQCEVIDVESLKEELKAYVQQLVQDFQNISYADWLKLNKAYELCKDHLFPDDIPSDKKLQEQIRLMGERFLNVITNTERMFDAVEDRTHHKPTIGQQTGAVVDYTVNQVTTGIKSAKNVITPAKPKTVQTTQRIVIHQPTISQRPVVVKQIERPVERTVISESNSCLRDVSNYIANIRPSTIIGTAAIITAGTMANLTAIDLYQRSELPAIERAPVLPLLQNDAQKAVNFNIPVLLGASAMFALKGANRVARYLLDVKDVKAVTCEYEENLV